MRLRPPRGFLRPVARFPVALEKKVKKFLAITLLAGASLPAYANPVDDMIKQGFACSKSVSGEVICKKDGAPSKICNDNGSCFRIVYDGGLSVSDSIKTSSIGHGNNAFDPSEY